MKTTDAALRAVLRLNAASCLGFGLAAAFWPEATAAMLGTVPAWLVRVAGLGLVANGGHLLLASARRNIMPGEVLWFTLGDLSWWLASLGLIAAGIGVNAPQGVLVFSLIAVGVALLGMTQVTLLAAARRGVSPRAHLQDIGRSWMALPQGVKLWLYALNAAFLTSALFLPGEPARTALIAYVASGPVLMAFAGHHGGMTRHMGIAHLVPWLPLLAWQASNLASGAWSGPAAAHAALLAAFVAICLALDVWDLWRWLNGDRGVLGRPAA